MMNTIYLIDDDRDILKSIGLFLQDEGYQIKSFERVADFKASLPLDASAIILTDMQMSDATGLDLQHYLLDENIDVPILFMSGNSLPEQIITALKQGANDFLLKPVMPVQLLTSISSAFDALNQRQLSIKDLSSATERLTPKEREVAFYIKQGFSNKSIANTMNLKADTIKKRRAQIYAKFNCTSFPEFLKIFTS
jgi:FixJ family two-component response regulator